MIKIGEYCELMIFRDTSVGLYLGDNTGQTILLPRKYCPNTYEIGDALEVFVYRDSEDELIATTLEPAVTLHQFAFLQVKEVARVGAFLDWGLEKDLFVPYKEQPQKMEKDRSYLVYCYLDEKTDRLAASARINLFLDNEDLTIKENDEVDLIIANRTDMGRNVIINHRHRGLIYANEIFGQLKKGDQRKGFVHQIREENKIDIRLQKSGYAAIEPNAKKILDMLQVEGGFMPLTDKSSPDLIYDRLEMSKKVFKKAIGSLYKQKLIRLEKEGVYIL